MILSMKKSLWLLNCVCESHALVDSLKYEITVLVENNQSLENELKGSKELSRRLSSDNLKNLFCVKNMFLTSLV
jgi:hypothetical protein